MAVYKPKYRSKGETLQSKTWWVEFVLKGERIRKSTGETNKRKAEAFEAAYRTQLLLGHIGIETETKEEKKTAPTFAVAMAEFLAASASRHNIAPSTTHRYKIASVSLLLYFGNKKVDRVTDADINEYITKRLKQKSRMTGGTIAPATVNRERTCLSRMFAYLQKAYDISSPFHVEDGEEPTIEYLEEDNLVDNPLSYEDEPRYLEACSPMLRDFATIMIDTGMRNSEVLNLIVSDIDLANGKLYIRTRQAEASKRKRRVKSKASRRTVFLTERVKEILARRTLSSTNGLIFAGGKDGKSDVPPVKLNNAHYAALKRSGVKRFRLYDLRHTFGSRQGELGTDPYALRDLLGHSGLDMLKRYVHPSDEHKANAIRRMEAARAAN
ncbi:MAG: site-specific integrase [Acidobacteriota bacterium]